MKIGAADRGRRARARSAWARPAALILALLILPIACAAAVLVAGIAYYHAVRPTLLDLTGRARSIDAVRSLWRVPYDLVDAFTGPPVERIYVDIAFKRMQKLREKRDEAFRIGVLMNSDDDFVPASIRHGDRSIPVKLRLKGDWTDHLEGDKWSLRIHTRKDDQLFGMRRFSIQNPATRGFQGEPILLAHLRREGVVVPRYLFVDVTVNGSDIGLMALEEHFSK